jgi:hypothetical protein
MSNNNDTDNNELNAIVNGEQSGDPQSDILENQEKSEQMEEVGILDLKEDLEKKVDSLSPQEIAAQQQEDAWTNKVLSGKADIEEVPQWLKYRVEKRLNSTIKNDSLKDELKKVVQAELEESQFVELQEKISSEKLPKKLIEELKQQYNEFRPLGKLKALNLAYKFIINNKQEVKINNGTALPPSGQPKKLKANDILSVAQDEKAWNALVRQRN